MRKCKPSWLDIYLQYTSTQESPKAFHQWVGLSLISAVLKRNIWIPRIKYTLYPNLFVVLVAGSAKCRKSVSLGIGKDMLYHLKEPPVIFAQKITTEALIETLDKSKKEDCCHGVILASELSVFLGADAIRSGIIPVLTDLYDSQRDWEYHTRGRGKEHLHNVTLSMLAASTKDWIRTSIPLEAIGGGFTSRVIFVFEDAPSHLVLFPEGHEADDSEMKKILISDLEEIGKLHGEIVFSSDAKKKAWEWYENEATNIRDDKVDGYFGRKHDTMFKVATLLAVGEGDCLLVEERHITAALELLEKNEKHLDNILSSVTATSFNGNTDKIFHIVKKHGQIKHSELLRKCWRYTSAEELGEIMRTLVESGELECFMDTTNAKWYKRGKG